MKYRFYIVNSIKGDVWGTDDSQQAAEYSKDDDVFVIDAEEGDHILIETVGERFPIGKAPYLPE